MYGEVCVSSSCSTPAQQPLGWMSQMRLSQACRVAAKELKSNYHNMDMYQIIWLLNYGNLD